MPDPLDAIARRLACVLRVLSDPTTTTMVVRAVVGQAVADLADAIALVGATQPKVAILLRYHAEILERRSADRLGALAELRRAIERLGRGLGDRPTVE